jgi:hypothetical protein
MRPYGTRAARARRGTSLRVTSDEPLRGAIGNKQAPWAPGMMQALPLWTTSDSEEPAVALCMESSSARL